MATDALVGGDQLDQAARNCAAAYRMWAERMGKRAELSDDLSLADLELPVSLPPNNATLLRPLTEETMAATLERVRAFFRSADGGGYEIWSIWPTPNLEPLGFEGYQIPCLVRDAGGAGRPVPSELEVVEATDASTVRDAEVIVDSVFEARSGEGAMYRPELLGEDFRVWVGRVDGRPVATAAACIDDTFVGVYAVATIPEARGRGYGEAVTWAATTCRPELSATLQASPMGLPVYERMGYRTVAQFTVWEEDR